MKRRLSRAKAKIKAAGIPFAVPGAHLLPDRPGRRPRRGAEARSAYRRALDLATSTPSGGFF